MVVCYFLILCRCCCCGCCCCCCCVSYLFLFFVICFLSYQNLWYYSTRCPRPHIAQSVEILASRVENLTVDICVSTNNIYLLIVNSNMSMSYQREYTYYYVFCFYRLEFENALPMEWTGRCMRNMLLMKSSSSLVQEQIIYIMMCYSSVRVLIDLQLNTYV